MTRYPYLDWQTGWNPDVGLWAQDEPGHTVSVADLRHVHSGPNASMRLLVAAQAGCLDEIDVQAVLKALRRTQIQAAGPNRGRFLWYLEEPVPGDDHAIFFNGMSLSALWGVYRDEFSTDCQQLLAAIFEQMRVYAMRRVRSGGIHYPNEFLGYVLCAWLPSEFLGLDDCGAELLEVMERSADCWLDHGWGWGEHLSDIYANILLDELSLLLLLSRNLPKNVSDKLARLLSALLAIEDQFDGGPRVPAVRSYAFLTAPNHRNYRTGIRPLPLDASFKKSFVSGRRLDTCNTPYEARSGLAWWPLAHTLHSLGWHEMVGDPAESDASSKPRDVVIPCFQGAQAVARIEDDIRLGSLSRFPLMPTAEHRTWGLAWQCFPVALWRPGGEWGYLQWETLENGVRRSHPASEKHLAYLRGALTDQVRPPVVGRTYTVQSGGSLVALRIMPSIVGTWQELADRFRLIGCTAKVKADRPEDTWFQIAMTYPERTVSVNCVTLCPVASPELVRRDEATTDWEVRFGSKALGNLSGVVLLWGITLNGVVASAPQLRPDAGPPTYRGAAEQAWALDWDWPNIHWRLRIDPTDSTPLRWRG